MSTERWMLLHLLRSKDKRLNWAKYMFNKLVTTISTFWPQELTDGASPSTFIPLGLKLCYLLENLGITNRVDIKLDNMLSVKMSHVLQALNLLASML